MPDELLDFDNYLDDYFDSSPFTIGKLPTVGGIKVNRINHFGGQSSIKLENYKSKS